MSLQNVLDGNCKDPTAELLGNLVEHGEISPSAAKSVLNLHRQAAQKEIGEQP